MKGAKLNTPNGPCWVRADAVVAVTSDTKDKRDTMTVGGTHVFLNVGGQTVQIQVTESVEQVMAALGLT